MWSISRRLSVLCFLLFLCAKLHAQTGEGVKVVSVYQKGAFPLVHNGVATPILTAPDDAPVVGIAAEAVANDIELITGKKPRVISQPDNASPNLIIAGTIGQSALVKSLVASKKLDIATIDGQWESYKITVVNNPFPGIDQALVVVGSDRRGTAYGLFEISQRAGVSPWVWWADAKPEPRKSLYVLPGTFVQKSPSVKYRGIFINDEDWGLHPWAAKNMDTDIHDIGPRTYARVFELLLRLRANLIWPAMHDETKAFWYYPDNPVVADKYAIVIGSTHCDMMLRSNTFEWQQNFKNEYGVEPGPYRYDSNKAQVYKYWEDRVAAAKNYEAMYTIGMRGVRDGGISGPPSKEGKIALMETIMQDQRKLFQQYFGSPSKPLQIFCPYKEVLDLYKGGLSVPDDVTLVWTDDNFGYLRQLSDPAEQKRSGASGIYYHLSYLGAPHDYTWLSTTSPSLIAYEMTKAYQFGADRFWVVNVGDIKPAEQEVQFFMDMAWDTQKWTPENAYTYPAYFAEQIFGKKAAPGIAAIKSEYYRLAQQGRPEHTGILRFDSATAAKRLAAYQRLKTQVDSMRQYIPDYLQDAYFELIAYPTKCAALMNEKILYAGMSFKANGNDLATTFSKKSLAAFDEIKGLTNSYNSTIANGKWKGIISYAPRNLAVYGMPAVAAPDVLPESLKKPVKYDRRYLDTTGIIIDESNVLLSIPAANYQQKKDIEHESIRTMNGLGLNGGSIARYPFTGASFSCKQFSKAPYVDYTANLQPGTYRISIKCLPGKAMHKGRSLGMAVSVNDEQPQCVDIQSSKTDKAWAANIVRGYAEAAVSVTVTKSGKNTIRIYLLDTGLSLSRIDIIPN
ncbi:MAG: glycosyl hydrolase 115 family protein [Edaphocola sp.]